MIGVRTLFKDRQDAGRKLARRLKDHARDAVVLGIPRGGVIVAAALAERLQAPLDVIVARKLGAPNHPELGIGAVTANGGTWLNKELIEDIGVPPRYLQLEIERQREEARRREAQFRANGVASDLKGRTVIVVDDGLATGATLRAALRSARQQQPRHLIAAVPVGAPESCEEIGEDADEVICLHQPQPLWSVGMYYEDFEQTSDEEVLQALTAARQR